MIFLKKVNSSPLHIVVILNCIFTPSSSYAQALIGSTSIPTCSDFKDPENHIGNNTLYLTIPANRTFNSTYYDPKIVKDLIFTLNNFTKLKCGEQNAELRKIPWNLEKELPRLMPKDYNNSLSNTSDAHQHSYFTLSGHFYDHTSRYFYKPDGDYCVASHDESAVILKVCTVNEDCSASATPNTWCLPKCCAVGEMFRFWVRRCSAGGKALWNPPIYEGTENSEKKLNLSSKTLIFRMSQMHKNCQPKVYTKSTKDILFRWMSSVYSVHPQDPSQIQEKDDIKIIPPAGGEDGVVRPMFLNNRSGHWETIPNMEDFCIDGMFVKKNRSSVYTGKEDEFVIFYCKRINEKIVKLTNSWIYFAVSIVALFFLLLIIVIYAALWEKQNLHGMTILSYSVATFGGYLFLGLAHAVNLFDWNAAVGVNKRGPWCYGNAVLAHYFLISSYLWLTVMNFDLWWTFSSLRTVRRDSKEWKKLGWYSLVAWILPFVLVLIFIIIDLVYSDPEITVSVPGYTIKNCFALEKFRGEYIYIPIAIILGINILLIGLTMKIFISAGQTSKSFSGKKSNANRYSAKLFAKLFIVMGGASVVDFVTWYYNNKGYKPWAIAILEGISCLAPVALFALFCLNNRVVNQLREKYPALTDALEPILKCFKKRDRNNSTVTNSNDHSSTRTNATN